MTHTANALMMTGYGTLQENLMFQPRSLSISTGKQLLIEVKAAALNPIDYKIVDGLLRRMEKLEFPAPMGFDASGVVLEIGKAIDRFKVGDEVFLRTGRDNKGAFATHLIAAEDQVCQKPTKMNFEEAASIPLVGLTTVQHLTEYARAKPGQHLFINAGAGGIGTFAIQYAKAIGLEVTVQCNSKDETFLRPLGPDHFIFYDQSSYLDAGRAFDIVYDCLGGDHTLQSFQVIKPGGIVASIAGPPDRAFAEREGLGWMAKLFLTFTNRSVYRAAKKAQAQYVRALTRPDASQLETIRVLIDDGLIRAIIGKIYPLSEGIEALAYLKRGKAKGKVVLQMT